MYWLDLGIVVVIAWLTYRAFLTGLIREIVTTVALVAGAVLAGHFYGELSADIAFAIEDEQWRDLIAFASIFIGALVLGHIGAMLMRQAASLLLLGAFDRAGGAAFGFFKGLLLVEVLLFAALAFPVSDTVDDAIDDSVIAPLFIEQIPVLLELLPPEFEEAADRLSGGALRRTP